MKVTLYANGTSENHGCEAIAQTTIGLLEGYFDKIYVSTTNEGYEKKLPSVFFNNPKCQVFEYYYYRKKTFINLLISKIERVFFNKNTFYTSKPWLSNMIDAFNKSQIAISIGGDNYCNNDKKWLYAAHNIACDKNLYTILWGCSVEDDCLTDKEMQKDLLRFDMIYARESITFRTLSKFHPNVKLYPDPAFLLNSREYKGIDLINKSKTVGINVSPTIMDFENKKGIVYKNYYELIDNILSETELNIALIPHVTFNENTCDYAVLNQLYEEFKYTKRIHLFEDHNCEETKGYISQCRFFIAARTHASIAAYSSCVPTLVVGYSVKARGIAEDLFGDWNKYVIPVQELHSEFDLTVAFSWLKANEIRIREHLEMIMPSYVNKIYDVKQEIFKIRNELKGEDENNV